MLCRWCRRLRGLNELLDSLEKIKKGKKREEKKKKGEKQGGRGSVEQGAERHFSGIAGSPAQLSPHTASLGLPDLSILH